MILLWFKYSFEEYPHLKEYLQLLECAGDKRYLRHEERHLYSVKEYFPWSWAGRERNKSVNQALVWHAKIQYSSHSVPEGPTSMQPASSLQISQNFA